MLVLRLRMEFTPPKGKEAIAVLRGPQGPVRSEPGCCDSRLSRDVDTDCALSWEEEWSDHESFEQHLRTMSFRRILAVMELATTTPEVMIDEIGSRRGFELVEELLGGGPAHDPM